MVASLPCFYCIFVLKWVSVYLYQVIFYSYLYIDMSSSNLCNLYLYLPIPWYNSNKIKLLSINMLQLLSWLTTKYIRTTRILTAEKPKKLVSYWQSSKNHICVIYRVDWAIWYGIYIWNIIETLYLNIDIRVNTIFMVMSRVKSLCYVLFSWRRRDICLHGFELLSYLPHCCHITSQ